MEKWYSVEPTKGYVIKSDFDIIERNLKEIYRFKVKLIKKQKFILIVIVSDTYTDAYNVYNVLKNKDYKKVYVIKTLTDSKGKLTERIFKERYIGLPY